MQRIVKGNVTIETRIDENLAAIGDSEEMGLRNAGREVEKIVKRETPKGDTGKLEESISHEVSNKYHTLSIISDNSVAPYNYLIEYGTPKMQAQPFMRQTIDGQRIRILGIVAASLGAR